MNSLNSFQVLHRESPDPLESSSVLFSSPSSDQTASNSLQFSSSEDDDGDLPREDVLNHVSNLLAKDLSNIFISKPQVENYHPKVVLENRSVLYIFKKWRILKVKFRFHAHQNIKLSKKLLGIA